MGRRRDRLDKRLANQIATRRVNSLKKEGERSRRDEQMVGILKAGQLPYTQGVMSYLSTRLQKKASRITAADVKSLL